MHHGFPIILSVIVVVVHSRKGFSVVSNFEEFQFQHGLNYSLGTAEYHRRNEIFQASLAAVKVHNDKPNQLWTAGINHLSDRTPEEMKAFNGWRGGVSKRGSSASTAFLDVQPPPTVGGVMRAVRKHIAAAGSKLMGKSSGSNLPEEKTYLHLWTAQKEQIHSQECGNCWAAATASLLEAHAEIHMKKQRHFSFNEITECTENPYKCGGSGGCGGATSELALQEVMKNGIGDEEGKMSKCAGTKHIVNQAEVGSHEWGDGVRQAGANDAGRKMGLVAWERLPQNKYEPVLRALVERGPVAVAVDPSWQNYATGIYDGCSKDATITHAVLAMGFGKDKKLDNTKYWVIQNSWGTSFGENGHIRLKRFDNEEEHCGVDKQPELGTTCDAGPKEVKVCGMCGMLYDVTVPHFEGPGKP